ncbi:MAG: hypothetical protein GC180_02810 [Bacteroidetes bacterium]|nr:hypothetical protein [Bacteroidota bacterium]
MKKLFNFLLGISIILFMAYAMVEIVKLGVGGGHSTWAGMREFFAGGTIILLIVWYYVRNRKDEDDGVLPAIAGTDGVVSEPEIHSICRMIITAEEGTCSRIDTAFREHPLVSSSTEESGHSYASGETGPEWYTVTLETSDDKKLRLEEALNEWLDKNHLGVSNVYWG